LGSGDELDCVGTAIVINGLALPLDVLVNPLTLLPEKRQLPRLGSHHAKLIALRVLPDLNASTANLYRALGQHNPTSKHAELLDIVIAQGISLNVHGFVSIRLFSVQASCRQGQQNRNEPGSTGDFHKGTNLALRDGKIVTTLKKTSVCPAIEAPGAPGIQPDLFR
jgi:hypothetical protein